MKETIDRKTAILKYLTKVQHKFVASRSDRHGAIAAITQIKINIVRDMIEEVKKMKGTPNE